MRKILLLSLIAILQLPVAYAGGMLAVPYSDDMTSGSLIEASKAIPKPVINADLPPKDVVELRLNYIRNIYKELGRRYHSREEYSFDETVALMAEDSSTADGLKSLRSADEGFFVHFYYIGLVEQMINDPAMVPYIPPQLVADIKKVSAVISPFLVGGMQYKKGSQEYKLLAMLNGDWLQREDGYYVEAQFDMLSDKKILGLEVYKRASESGKKRDLSPFHIAKIEMANKSNEETKVVGWLINQDGTITVTSVRPFCEICQKNQIELTVGSRIYLKRKQDVLSAHE